ncbi:MBL fold metallo-hydrolase [Chitinophaga sedimenti]|uniref:MBL fold metallo-hydrolase n=1 Tax=Chitinophaga sedimenti TaxID=2033606 RepID=UPI002006A351|nr:MBL fold metallo-hydrolase [Chitinophaga sedimenti]MCK7554039.1 MBL fold metallo-hydrolase [Chitinophaga sedimenti]
MAIIKRDAPNGWLAGYLRPEQAVRLQGMPELLPAAGTRHTGGTSNTRYHGGYESNTINRRILYCRKGKAIQTIITGSSYPEGESRAAIRPFLIEIANEFVLLDTGLDGAHILSLLQEQNVQPEQVTKILLSHLHKDHSNGLGHFEGADFIPHFPNATIYLQRRELDYANSKLPNPSYLPEVLEALVTLPQIQWLNEDAGQLTPEISFQVTGGHTPFHQVFWIRGQDQTVFYGGDNLPKEGYLDPHVAYKNDDDGKKAMEWRIKWEEEGRAEHWQCLLYHDMRKPFITL